MLLNITLLEVKSDIVLSKYVILEYNLEDIMRLESGKNHCPRPGLCSRISFWTLQEKKSIYQLVQRGNAYKNK